MITFTLVLRIRKPFEGGPETPPSQEIIESHLCRRLRLHEREGDITIEKIETHKRLSVVNKDVFIVKFPYRNILDIPDIWDTELYKYFHWHEITVTFANAWVPWPEASRITLKYPYRHEHFDLSYGPVWDPIKCHITCDCTNKTISVTMDGLAVNGTQSPRIAGHKNAKRIEALIKSVLKVQDTIKISHLMINLNAAYNSGNTGRIKRCRRKLFNAIGGLLDTRLIGGQDKIIKIAV